MYTNNSAKGLILILEVDLEYPSSLHRLHNDHPLTAEKLKVTEEMLSRYWETIRKTYKISFGQVKKLIPTLSSEERYVLHYRNLQLYLDLGLKLKKVHCVLEFHQSPWLRQYIDFNAQKRMNAKNSFEKDFFKLMNNSVFGKTMENIIKRVDVRLVTDENKLSKLASKPTYVTSKILNENLVAVHKIRDYVGTCILDLTKTLMYDFHYNYIKKKYKSRAKLLFTDTDSLMYEIKAKDIVYQDFWTDRDKFDNSDYSKYSQYFDPTNKKVIGKFKDEAVGIPVTGFIGLRSKMYSYVEDNDKNEKTAKGIKKYLIKKITHQDYKDTLQNNKKIYHSMKTIRSVHHQLGSYDKIRYYCHALMTKDIFMQMAKPVTRMGTTK